VHLTVRTCINWIQYLKMMRYELEHKAEPRSEDDEIDEWTRDRA
jgi:hypothetical protein